jgi:hypothetical protein
MRIPHWVSSVLLAGSLLLVLWGLFVLSFKSEPSAVGRVHVALYVIGGASIGTAIVGGVAAVGLIWRARWATAAAWAAAVLMVLTVVSSWAGVVASVGLIAGRRSPKT